MGVLIAILASILIALGNVILKKSFKELSPAISFFLFSMFGMLIWFPVAFTGHIQFNELLLGFIGGIASAVLGQLSYIYVLGKGELSITATILSTYSIYTIILSVLINGDTLSPIKALFILTAILGTVIVSLPEKFIKEDFKKLSYVLFAVGAAVCIGSSDALSKLVIDKTSIGTFYFAVAISQFVISFIYLWIAKEPLSQFKELIIRFNDFRYAIFGSLALSVGTLFLFLAFNFTIASIASPITSTYPVITIFLALLILKEKINIKSWIGLTLVIIAVLGVSFL